MNAPEARHAPFSDRPRLPLQRTVFTLRDRRHRLLLSLQLCEDGTGTLPLLWVGNHSWPLRARTLAAWVLHWCMRTFAPGTPGWFLAALLVVVLAPALLLWGLFVVGAPR